MGQKTIGKINHWYLSTRIVGIVVKQIVGISIEKPLVKNRCYLSMKTVGKKSLVNETSNHWLNSKNNHW